MQTKSYVAFLILFLILASAAPVVAQDTAQTKEVLVPEITKVTLDSIPRNWSSLSLLYPTIYHPPNRVVDEVEHFEQSVPQLVDTEVLGYSYEGRPIVSMRITNELATRPKAKTLVVANHHGREQITVELALRFALWLLNGYGNNPNITHYIDTEEIFIIPMLNPDALQRVVVNYDNWLRKNLRPWDEDRDGIADEDPPDDANLDGIISEFQEFNKIDGKLELRATYLEGSDNDEDGRVNEDGFGLVDLNRNYDMWWGQPPGASHSFAAENYCGPIPFSESETRAFRNFARRHEFAIAYSLHSGINATYFPSDGENVYPLPELYDIILDDYSRILPTSFTSGAYADRSEIARLAHPTEFETAVGGYWKEWMYYVMQTPVPITFEVYHDPRVDENSAYVTIFENDSLKITEWKGMFAYFNPPFSKVNALWGELRAGFEYLLQMTPRLNMNITPIDNEYINNGTVIVNVTIATHSLRLDSKDGVGVFGADGALLSSLWIVQPGDPEFDAVEISVPSNITQEDYVLLVGNDYTGYTEYRISAHYETITITNDSVLTIQPLAIGFAALVIIGVLTGAIVLKKKWQMD